LVSDDISDDSPKEEDMNQQHQRRRSGIAVIVGLLGLFPVGVIAAKAIGQAGSVRHVLTNPAQQPAFGLEQQLQPAQVVPAPQLAAPAARPAVVFVPQAPAAGGASFDPQLAEPSLPAEPAPPADFSPGLDQPADDEPASPEDAQPSDASPDDQASAPADAPAATTTASTEPTSTTSTPSLRIPSLSNTIELGG
jgi:hypothetical protein